LLPLAWLGLHDGRRALARLSLLALPIPDVITATSSAAAFRFRARFGR